MPTELRTQLNILSRSNTAASHKLVMDILAQIPGFSIDKLQVRALDQNMTFAPIEGMLLPDNVWPMTLAHQVSGLLHYQKTPLICNFEGDLYVIKLPAIKELRNRPIGRIIKRMLPSTRGWGNRVPNPAEYSYWPIGWREKDWVKSGKPPTAAVMADIGLYFWEGSKELVVKFDTDGDTIQAFGPIFEKTYQAYTKLAAKNKTRDEVANTALERYMKEIWTPRQAWYNALTEAQRKLI